MTKTLTVGTRVRWTDPDPIAGCPNTGVVVAMQHTPPMEDSVISLKMDDGGEVEALPHELRPLRRTP